MVKRPQPGLPIGGERGFTLVELLVAMLIIGLLAAIAIPTFLGQRDKARDASAKTAARTAATAMETFRTDHGGAYTGATAGDLDSIESTLSTAALAVVSAADDQYALRVTSSTGNAFTIERHPDGTTDFTCSVAADAGCPASGVWAGG